MKIKNELVYALNKMKMVKRIFNEILR